MWFLAAVTDTHLSPLRDSITCGVCTTSRGEELMYISTELPRELSGRALRLESRVSWVRIPLRQQFSGKNASSDKLSSCFALFD